MTTTVNRKEFFAKETLRSILGELCPTWCGHHGGVTQPAQESVWDYPRPPACVASGRHVLVRLGDTVVAETRDAFRVLETSHPPTWYLPRDSVSDGVLERSAAAGTWCEWKGAATYWDVLGLTAAAWSYETPSPGYEAIAGYVTFYPAAPGLLDRR